VNNEILNSKKKIPFLTFESFQIILEIGSNKDAYELNIVFSTREAYLTTTMGFYESFFAVELSTFSEKKKLRPQRISLNPTTHSFQ